ncbi:MAG: hypothetical protein LBK13_08975 [Spirochaetales bacterium]|jgi:hypothetical protein|nr:hypothetical protein [Spirochaetales bacterium]
MSDTLFARPSILEGIGRNIDLFGVMNIYNYSENDAEADAMAFAADAAALKNDFDSVLPNLNVEQK